MADRKQNRRRIDPQQLDPETRERIRRRRAEMRRRRRKRALMLRAACVLVLAALIVGIVAGISAAVKSSKLKQEAKEQKAQQEAEAHKEQQKTREQKIEDARLMAVQYDYDGAIESIKSIDGAMEDAELVTQLADLEEEKSNLKTVPANKITHLSVRALVADAELVFVGQEDTVAAQNRLTVDEFKKILQQLYENGYVLVSIHDLVNENEDGEFGSASVSLPEGKKPFILSQEDVCYNPQLAGKGYATKLILEGGKLVNQYQQQDGTVVTGAYDVVPIVDEFIEEHPDFSYRGARGLLGFSGEYGILGYQTTPENAGASSVKAEDEESGSGESPDSNAKDEDSRDQQKAESTAASEAELSAENLQEIENVKPILEALKAEGWEFASSGFSDVSYASELDVMKEDADLWEKYVESVIGETDVLLFPYGTDIASYTGYDEENENYTYLKGKGFRFFCNIDSSQYWVQIATEYVRQGRRSIDGLRLYQDAQQGEERLADLFDASLIYDSSRPDLG